MNTKKFILFLCIYISTIIGIGCVTAYADEDDTAGKLTEEQQYVRDLERQLNETRSELEKYQALDYNNDGKITALDAQMMLTYYAESLACDTDNDVSGYGEFVRN